MSYTCSVCGKIHTDFPALAFSAPHYYYILSEEDKASATLAEDFCIIEHEDQTDRFIRVVMSQAIAGLAATVEYGVWVSLSEQSFVFYMDHFEDDIEGTTFFGYLCSQVPGYEDTLLVRANVICGPKGKRPAIFLHDDQADHPLVRDFIKGITPEEADKRIHLVLDRV